MIRVTPRRGFRPDGAPRGVLWAIAASLDGVCDATAGPGVYVKAVCIERLRYVDGGVYGIVG